MPDYYDWILFGIIASLVTGWLLGALTWIPMEVGLAIGVVVATPIVYDAMFRNPPIPANERGRAVAAVVWHVLLVGSILVALF